MQPNSCKDFWSSFYGVKNRINYKIIYQQPYQFFSNMRQVYIN